MGALFPEIRLRGPVLGQALLLGAALGALAFAGGGFLTSTAGTAAAAVGVLLPLVAAVGAGIWAGVPRAERLIYRLRNGWYAAAVGVGVAGAVATLLSVRLPLASGFWGGSITLLLMIALPGYLLGLLLPVLLAWAEREEALAEDEHAETVEDETGWGPLGVVVLGVLAGLALGGALTALLLAPRFGAGPLLLGVAAALIVPTLLPEREETGATERELFATESPISTIRVVEIVYPGRRQPERRLYVNGEEESGELVRSGAPTLPYIAAAEQWLASATPRGAHYLFLGGGAYTLPRRVVERDPGARATVVELDPEVTRVAGRFFGLRPEHRIVSVHGDARAAIEREPGGEYDRIFVDVYGGSEALPYSLVTREAFGALRNLLRPGGWLLLNTIGVTEGAEARRFWSIVRTLGDAFPTVALYTHLGRDFPERQNGLLAASPDPDATAPERAGFFERWPHGEWPAWEGTAVLRDLFERDPAAEPPAPRPDRSGLGARIP